MSTAWKSLTVRLAQIVAFTKGVLLPFYTDFRVTSLEAPVSVWSDQS